jgi:glycosyltransferase involved in cell wall biosynthesis
MHLITSLDTGGAEMMLYKLVARSDREKIRHVVVSLVGVGPIGESIAALGIPVHSLNMRRGIPDPRAAARLVGVLRSVAPDVLQTWLYHADLLGLLGGALVRVPVVWNIRSSFNIYDLGALVAIVAKASARLSPFPAAVVTNSEAAKKLHTQIGYHPREWLVIPNGFDLQSFVPNMTARRAVRQELGLPDDALLIGLVARFDPLKDHRTFLRAAAMLREQWPEAHFVLVGQGVTASNEALRETIAANGLRDRVHLLGERADIPTLTAAFDIATCSSYGESFPNAVGEAMACAVPCVVTDVGDARRIVGETGRVVSPRNASELAAAWDELLDLGAEGRQELGRLARDRIETHYGLDAVVRQYEALYERLSRRGPPATGHAS